MPAVTIDRFALPPTGLAAARLCLAQRVPAGDPAQLRVAARRSSAFADVLRRSAGMLLSGVESGLWSGPAHRALSEQVRTHAPDLRATAERYDGYADALTGYAGVLDDTAGTLLAVRRQLRQRTEEPAALGTGPAPDAELLSLARAFKAGYDRWADGLERCLRALVQVDGSDPTRDLHGIQELGHRIGHASAAVLSPFERAVLHPSLSNISTCLGELNVGLSLLGLGLLVICPPAAAACLAAATVLAVAQLAVDSTRRAHGESVSASSLGFELAAAIPLGGNAVRSLRAAQDVVHLVPGGGLAAHEAAGGHTLAKHVGKSEAFLRNRLATEPRLRAVSSFYDRQTAEESIHMVIKANEKRLNAWLTSPNHQLELNGTLPADIGRLVVPSSATVTEEQGVRIVLRRTRKLPAGYYVYTAMVTE